MSRAEKRQSPKEMSSLQFGAALGDVAKAQYLGAIIAD